MRSFSPSQRNRALALLWTAAIETVAAMTGRPSSTYQYLTVKPETAMSTRVWIGIATPIVFRRPTTWGTRYTSRNTRTPQTTTRTSRGYAKRRMVWDASSSCQRRAEPRFSNTSVNRPVCSPALTRLTKTAPNTEGCAPRHWESSLPPSISSSIAVRISRKRVVSTESRRSRKPSMIGMPERVICSMS